MAIHAASSINQIKSFLIRDLLEPSKASSIDENDDREDVSTASQFENLAPISREQLSPIRYANLCHLQASTNIWPSMTTVTCFTCINSSQDQTHHWNSG